MRKWLILFLVPALVFATVASHAVVLPAEVYADSDTTAPGTVADLSVADDQDGGEYWKWSVTSLRLSWTAPGDDGATGTATSYDIRYSTSQQMNSHLSKDTKAET